MRPDISVCASVSQYIFPVYKHVTAFFLLLHLGNIFFSIFLCFKKQLALKGQAHKNLPYIALQKYESKSGCPSIQTLHSGRPPDRKLMCRPINAFLLQTQKTMAQEWERWDQLIGWLLANLRGAKSITFAKSEPGLVLGWDFPGSRTMDISSDSSGTWMYLWPGSYTPGQINKWYNYHKNRKCIINECYKDKKKFMADNDIYLYKNKKYKKLNIWNCNIYNMSDN